METSGVKVSPPAQLNETPAAVRTQNGALSPKQMTIPKNGVATNNSGISKAAAAADATAMPPPPPHTAPGLARTSVAVSAAPSTTLATSVPKPATISITNASVARAPQSTVPTPLPRAPVTTAATQAISAPAPSSTIAVTKVSNPLAKTPTTVVTTTVPGRVAVKPATTSTVVPQRTLTAANNHALLAKKPLTASKPIVPSPVLSTGTAKTIQHQGIVRTAITATGVPQPVISSTPATARVATTAAAGGAHQQRVVPKYLTKAPASAIPGSTLKRTVVGTTPASSGAKPVLNGRPVIPRPSMTASTVTKQQTAIPSPTATMQQHIRPTPVASSGIATAPVPMSAPQSMPPPPPPPPQETISTASTGGSSSGSSKKKGGHPLRRGKWTSEEEAYAGRLINEFKAGLLPLTDGTTLRNFLSKLLNCDPMRISKKFVGNNCIGKQVFRRRVADINRLTPEQIQQMRVDLCELERRFFDRVSQTNRVKTPGVSSPMSMAITGAPVTNTINIINIGPTKVVREEMELDRPPTPPWLRPPANYKPKGKFAERLKKKQMAAEAAAARVAEAQAAAAAAVAVPPPPPVATAEPVQKVSVSSTPPLVDVKSDTEKAMEAIQRSHSSLDRLAQAAQNEDIPRTESALEQLARTASAAKFVEDIVNGDSSLGDTQAEGGKKLSQATLQGSFEALMSMDIHSVENLVELASSHSSQLLSELAKSSSSDGGKHNSSGNMSSRMESFIKSLSSANLKAGFDSSVALGSLLNASSSSIFDAEKFSKRVESSTGFSQLRAADGLATGSHNSVEDFLSLVASGDLPHQDPNILNVPLQKVMQQTGLGQSGSKRKLSQQQLVALATRLGSSRSLSEMAAQCSGSAAKKRKKK